MFVYLGPTPSFTGCSQNVWIASGNLIGSTDGRLRHEPDPVRRRRSRPTPQALALVGSYQVTGISLVVDSSFAFTDKEQTVRIRNVKINALDVLHRHDALRRRTAAGSTRRRRARSCARRWAAAAFRAAYGTNANGANAFGKCVSAMARMKTDARALDRRRADRHGSRAVREGGDSEEGEGQGEGAREAGEPRRLSQEERLSHIGSRSAEGLGRGSPHPSACLGG